METQFIKRLNCTAAMALPPANDASPLFTSQTWGLTGLLLVYAT